MNPTPRPCKAYVGNPYDCGAEESAQRLSLEYKDHVFDMTVFSGNVRQSKAVLDEIVRAVNSYDTMREALSYVREALLKIPMDDRTSMQVEAVNSIKDALALAEGKE